MAAAEYYTIDEVALLLKVKPITIRRLIERGELKTVKVGRQYRISAEDLGAYLKRER